MFTASLLFFRDFPRKFILGFQNYFNAIVFFLIEDFIAMLHASKRNGVGDNIIENYFIFADEVHKLVNMR